jgi:V/A-type H+-transporting ATPase subunit I
MIIRMSKVEIVGPKGRLIEVLTRLGEKGILQLNDELLPRPGEEPPVKALLPDQRTLAERTFFLNLQKEIRELLATLPAPPLREAYLAPLPVIDVIAALLQKHLPLCLERNRTREMLLREMHEVAGYEALLQTLEPLMEKATGETALEFIGVTIRDPALIERFRRLAAEETAGRFELATAIAADGGLVGLIATEKGMAKRLRRVLSDGQIPEFSFPKPYSELPLVERAEALRHRLREVEEALARLDEEEERFARHWLPIYRRVLQWLSERLSLLEASAAVFETGMCFYIQGWTPAAAVAPLRDDLEGRFQGEVLLSELAIREEDLDRVPVALQNPPYFRPFELLSRLLPLPRYTSFDPTTFLGLFFPLFFGMILGDIGYGLILAVVVVILLRTCRKRQNISDAAKILGVCAGYSLVFGWLFGEFFGDFGAGYFGLEPILFERSQSLLPLLYFSLSVGFGHILLGLILGVLTALNRHLHREALVKLLGILFLLALVALLAGQFAPHPWLRDTHLILALLGITLLALFAGGMLAPLELLKSVGNIISYTRIMAIGLTSVLLAQIANRLGGMTGDVFAGILVAGLLHFFNLILGVFAPTVHALRLHYVEFFSKFLEPGGRRFEPLDKSRP